MDFYAHTRDPKNPAYTGNDGKDGFRLETRQEGSIENVLLEGNHFRFYKDQVIQANDKQATVRNIILRRNTIVDNYDGDANSISVGCFSKDVDGLLLEENIFDRNGWLVPSRDGTGRNSLDGQATVYNHNAYLVDVKNTTFKNNSLNRTSSIGTKWVAKSGAASSRDITIIDNFFNDFEIGISMGNNFPGGSYRFKNISIENNVFVHPGRSNPTRRALAWGLILNDWDKGSFSNNIITSQPNPANSAFGISIDGDDAVGATIGSTSVASECFRFKRWTNESPAVRIFPNPVYDTFQIWVPKSDGNKSFSVSDLEGRPLIDGTITDQTRNVDISAFNPGVYTISVRTDEIEKTVKIIKE